MTRKVKNILMGSFLALIIGLSIYTIGLGGDSGLEGSIDTIFYFLFGIESLVFSGIMIYLFMSNFNGKDFRETFELRDKPLMYFLSVLVLGLFCFILLLSIVNVNSSELPSNDNHSARREFDVNNGVVVTEKMINLYDYSSNIIINEAGEYTITGTFYRSIIINSDDEVVLNLDDVRIESLETASILNLNSNNLVINLIDDSVNFLEDNGYSVYDSCIYSAGPLIINGNGKLQVYGMQKEGAGIKVAYSDLVINSGNLYIEANGNGLSANGNITINSGDLLIDVNGYGIRGNKQLSFNGGTLYVVGSTYSSKTTFDLLEGFSINGGTLVAISSNELNEPLLSSTQKSIVLNLDKEVSKNTLLTFLDQDGQVLLSFVAKTDLVNLLVSSETFKSYSYFLYEGGNHTGLNINGIMQDGTYSNGELLTTIVIEDPNNEAM